MSPGGPPLLVLAPGFRALYANGQVLEYDGPLAVPDSSYFNRLEAAEFERARQRSSDADALAWRPAAESLRYFLEACERRAAAAGQILIHSRLDPPAPLESLRLDGADWAAQFALVRLAGIRADARPAGGRAGAHGKLRLLVYWNPAGGEALPAARREAEEAAALFETRADVRFVARSLSRGELDEAISAADCLCYFGHGESAAGQPLVPAGRERAPLISAAAAAAGPLAWVAYQACHVGEQALRPRGAQAFLYPVCRIADRATAYNRALLGALASGADLSRAAHAAARADAEQDDVRRFMFRVQCDAV